MCGIVGAVAQRDVSRILLEGLRNLEYRGYDSAGLAIIDRDGNLWRRRAVGKVEQLAGQLDVQPLAGAIGVAHTRWATHGPPTEPNAHPHVSGLSVAVVHNGIIENHEDLRDRLVAEGYRFESETDTEVVAHMIHACMQRGLDLRDAVRATVADLRGAYALGVVCNSSPDVLVAARSGSPLVIGVGIGEHFIASDAAALLPVTRDFVFLEDGDVASLTRDRVDIINVSDGNAVSRPVKRSALSADAVDKAGFRHYMLKEIHEQPAVIGETLADRLLSDRLIDTLFGPEAKPLLDAVQRVQIVACGTSYHAGLIARHWLEAYAGLACDVEVASEYRYRAHVVVPGSLFVVISQSGETADTLAALENARQEGKHLATLAICNVPESSLVRAADLTLMTHAGPEIGVASTKAFTTQLVALLLLVVELGRRRGMSSAVEHELVDGLRALPAQLSSILALEPAIERLAVAFADKHHSLFLGRGAMYPVAMEGALKLKEISYIHAEAYPAGELKHGPLALVDSSMPVVTVAPDDVLLGKLKSNLQEVRARGGELFVFADQRIHMESGAGMTILPLPAASAPFSAILYTVPLQLLAYHVALLKGTDVDRPRNLAKSVTVE